MRAAARAGVAAALACALVACGSLPERPSLPVSTALAPAYDSPLAGVAAASVSDPALSGFRLMPLGLYALDARIELIRHANRSLDVQYYLIQNDRTGRLFMRELRNAAQRGVRIRLLVDDLYTAGGDEMFAGLAAFTGVEVRLFNPFCCGRASVATRFAASLGDIARLNHRMHNKLLVADGALAVMGGRNIADEYFTRGAASNFVDMDVLVVGKAVLQLSTIFDAYWNSAPAFPASLILGEPTDAEQARRSFGQLVDEGEQMMAVTRPPVDMLGQRPLRDELAEGRLTLPACSAVAFADAPGKVMAMTRETQQAMTVQMDIMDRIAGARRQVVISSPYFVPGATGVAIFERLRKRGIDVVVLTNSLASNDVLLVHLGYSRYRTSLVRAGIELYELDGAGSHRDAWDMLPGMSQGRLHAKAAVLDGATVYIGSMNLDPRSENTNTELGMVAQCAELARDVTRVIDVTRRRGAWRLRLGPDDTLQWVTNGEGADTVLTTEPDTNPLLDLRNMLLQPFIPERLL